MTRGKIDTRRPDIEPGDVFYVRATTGLPQGRRGRAGMVFTASEETKVTVVDGSRTLQGGEVHVSGARLIMEDPALIKTTQPTVDLGDRLRGDLDAQIAKCAASDAEVQRLAAEVGRLSIELETRDKGLQAAISDGKKSDAQIAELRNTIKGLQVQLDKAK